MSPLAIKLGISVSGGGGSAPTPPTPAPTDLYLRSSAEKGEAPENLLLRTVEEKA